MNRKKKIIIWVSAVFIILLTIGVVFYKIQQDKRITYQSEEFGFSITYSSEYRDKKLENSLLNVVHKSTGIRLYVEAHTTPKVDLDLETIKENYIATLKIYNEESTIEVLQNEDVIMNGYTGGKLVLDVTEKGKTNRLAVLLFPLEDREITIVIMGNSILFEWNQEEIEEMIKSIQLK